DRMAIDPHDQRAIIAKDTPGRNIADMDTTQSTGRRPFRSAQAGAQTQKDRCCRDVAHRQVADGHVLDNTAVNCFDCQAARAFESAVLDADTTEIAARFGAELDAASDAVAVGR